MPLEITAIAGKKGFRVVGQAYGGGKMKLKDWPHPLVVDYAGLTVPPSVPLLINHENHPNAKIGAVAAKREGASFLVDGEIIVQDETGPAAKIVAPLLPPEGQPTTGDISRDWQLSIGAAPQRVEFIPAGHSRVINGTSHEGPFFHVKQSVLREISVVAIGADASTWMRLAATFGGAATDAAPTPDGGTTMPFDAWLKAHGLEGKKFTEAQTTELKAAFDAGQPPPKAFTPAHAPTGQPPTPAPAKVEATAGAPDIQAAAQTAATAALTVERSRIAGIRARCKGLYPQIEAKAIDEGWTLDQTNAALLDQLMADRPQAPNIMARTQAPVGGVIEAAALLTGGIPETAVVASLGEQVTEGARKRYRHGMGLQRMILEAAWANGCPIQCFDDDMRSVMRYAFGIEGIRAAFSSMSLPGILSNVANKFLLQGFDAIDQTWRAISSTSNARDFKTMTHYRLNGAFEFLEIGPDGELKHGEVSEESFTNQVKTYGRMFSITRVDIINDDLNALTNTPKLIGQGAATKFNTVFWTEFLNNSAFFTTGNGNYFSGAATALSVASLKVADAAFTTRKRPDGHPLGIGARILLVPTALKVDAATLMTSTDLNETTSANSGKPKKNPFAGAFDPQSTPYLQDSLIPNYSNTAWYLIASPGLLPVIDSAFLQGKQVPTVESADADFDTLGIQVRGFYDFGVKKQDNRGGVKMAGA